MSNFFGFHGERPGDRTLGGGAASKKRVAAKKTSSTQPTNPIAMMNNTTKSNPNMMTYNGMYNVSAVAPPAINQRPSRKATRSQGGNANVMMPQMVAPPMPVNASSFPSSYPPQPTLQISANTPSNDLQAKVKLWQQRRGARQTVSAAPPPIQQSQPQALAKSQGMFATEEEEDENDNEEQGDDDMEDDATQEQEEVQQIPVLPPVSKKKGGRAKSSSVTDTAPQNAMENAYLRKDITALRDEVAKLKDIVSVLNPGNQAGVIKMVEQQVQKILVDHNSLKGSLDQMLMMAKAQQNQLDQIAKVQVEGGTGAGGSGEAITPDELDEVIDGVKEEQTAMFGKLQEEVKGALQIMSDRSYWMYGNVLQEKVVLFETHELGSRVKSEMVKGMKLLLTYPMKRTNEGVWMKARSVSEDGSLSVAWVPIWTFSPSVLAKYPNQQPPAEEEKIIYLGKFSSVCVEN